MSGDEADVEARGVKRAAEEPAEGEPEVKAAAPEAEATEQPAEAPKEYKLGYKTFNGSKEILSYFHTLLGTLPSDVRVNEYEHKALGDLIKHHPRPHAKLKGGVVGFKKGHTHREGSTSTCFFAVYEDATESEFSYLKCVANLTGDPIQPKHLGPRPEFQGGRFGGRGGRGRVGRGRGGRGRR